MPLDGTGKKYAELLYHKRQEEILARQIGELGEVATDFGKRNMMSSGAYLSARAGIIGKNAGLMAEARAQTLLQAYEKAGQPLNQTTLQEITAEVNQFCDAKKIHLRQAASNLVLQSFPGGPKNLEDALVAQMQSALMGGTSRAIRDLSIKHHEILLDAGRVAPKVYATAVVDQKWDVFISHASEDKEGFVVPLARALEEAGVRGWLDATVLTVGDSLRATIDKGLAHSRYGIVVLSPSFFAKKWTQMELDGLVGKEVSGVKVILPVWHNIDFDGVQSRSPMLAGRIAAKSEDGMEKIVSELKKAMDR